MQYLRKKLLSIVLSLVMIVGLLPAYSISVTAATPKAYVTFTSDVHVQSGDASATRLDNWLTNVSTKIGGKIDMMGISGDLGPASGASSDFWNYAAKVFNTIENSSAVKGSPSGVKHFVVPGNHEYSPGSFDTTNNATTAKYKTMGTSLVEDNYIFYSMGATQGNETYKDSDIDAMKTFLKAHENFDGPIFILAHYPLHRYSGGMWGGGSSSGESSSIHDGSPAVGSSKIITALNACKNASNIFFIWGHNHSSSNDHYDDFYHKINDTDIKFTYCAAGCMSDSEYGASANVKGKGLVAEISDGEVDLEYYDKSYNVVKSTTIPMNQEYVEPDDPTPVETGEFVLTDKFEIGYKYIITTTKADGETYALANNGDRFDAVKVTISNGKISATSANTKAVWEAKSTGTGSGLIGLYNGSNVLKVDASDTSNPYIKTSDTSYNAGGFGYTADNHISYPYGQNPKDYYIGSQGTTSFTASNTESGLGKVYIFVNGDSGQTPDDPVVDGDVSLTPSTDNPTVSKTIKAGESFTLKVTNGSTNSSYTFKTTSQDTSVAQVTSNSSVEIGTGASANVVIKGLKAGKTTIKVTNGNTQYGTSYERTATINLTVTGEGGDTPDDPTPPPSSGDLDITPQKEEGGRPVVDKTIYAGDSFNLNITNASESNNDYTYSLTQTNGTVASITPANIDIAGGKTGTVVVKGLKAGTTTISITNNNDEYGEQYIRKATINLTVVEKSGDNTLDDLKKEAKAAIDAAVDANASSAVKGLAYDAKTAIDAATTASAVNAAKKDGLRKIADQKAKEAEEKALADAKEAAKKAIDNAAGTNPSDAVKKLAEDAKKAIDAATTVAGVTAAQTAGVNNIADQKAKESSEGALQAAKDAAKKAIDDAAGTNPSDEVKKLAEDAKKAIDAATTTEAVAAAQAAGAQAIATQKAKEEGSDKELQAAKDAAKKALDAAAGTNPSEAVKKLVEDAKAAIDAATSVDDVNKAKTTALANVTAQQNKEDPNSVENVDKAITTKPGDADQPGSAFGKLILRYASAKKTSIKVKWSSVPGATKYILYGSNCGTSYKLKKLTTTTARSFTYKKLKKGKYYKFLVIAVKGSKVIQTSKTVHICTKGGKKTNYKALTLNKKSVSLKKGKALKLKVKTTTKFDSKLKVAKHVGVRYESSNTRIATVSSKGKIKGVNKGTCNVFVYLQDGIYKKVKVTVK